VTLAVLLAAVAAYILWPRPSAEQARDEGFEAFEASEDPRAGKLVGPDASRAQAPRDGDDEPTGSVVVLEDRVERDDAPARSETESVDADSKGAQRDGGGGYADPVNDEVLGPKAWMADLPEEQREDIDEELDRQRPEPFPIDLEVRREGIEVAKAVVFDCYDALQRRQPQRTGRIIVSFDVVAGGGSATLRNTDVPTNVKLDDPQFESCIVDGINGLRIASSDEGTMRVEYPFLFDIEGKR
jgi:hypothetical protein